MGQVFHFHERRPRRDVEAPVSTSRPEQVQSRKARTERRVANLRGCLGINPFDCPGGACPRRRPTVRGGRQLLQCGLAGQPITWAGGPINDYTDQGNLSPILAGPDAEAFVADALSRWTTISTAAVSASHGGQLAEDVSGANVILNSDRSITIPADIQPSATTKPVAIVYDADGQVTDALIGAGASGDCFTNAAFGGADAFTTDGHFAYALLVLDGKCAQNIQCTA
jgi:hypothetical protein